MRKTALILIMLTLLGLSANVIVQEVRGQDGGQIIDSIVNDSEIVIGDTAYRIDPEAAFYSTDGKTLVDFSYFKEGDSVEFTLNSRGEIIELSKTIGR